MNDIGYTIKETELPHALKILAEHGYIDLARKLIMNFEGRNFYFSIFKKYNDDMKELENILCKKEFKILEDLYRGQTLRIKRTSTYKLFVNRIIKGNKDKSVQEIEKLTGWSDTFIRGILNETK